MKKILIIVIAIIIVAAAAYLIYNNFFKLPFSDEEKACVDSGGKISTALCCGQTKDFPNTCLIGACGCSPENSHEVKVCECPVGCWDGTKCVNSFTERTIKEILATKYNKNLADVDFNITKSDDTHVVGNVFFLANGQQGEGGGVLAINEQGEWKIVYDGNGSVDCSLLKNTYKFSSDLLTGYCD